MIRMEKYKILIDYKLEMIYQSFIYKKSIKLEFGGMIVRIFRASN